MTAEKRQKPEATRVPKDRHDHANDAREVLRLIVSVSGGELCGKTRLFKAFYAAHLIHFRERGERLTEYPIVHMPHGPGIHDATARLQELVDAGVLSWEIDRTDLYPESLFKALKPVEFDPTDPRIDAIHHAVEWVKSMSASDLSAETHEKSRSWRETSDGEEMNVYLDLLTDEEVESMRDLSKRVEQSVKSAFGG